MGGEPEERSGEGSIAERGTGPLHVVRSDDEGVVERAIANPDVLGWKDATEERNAALIVEALAELEVRLPRDREPESASGRSRRIIGKVPTSRWGRALG